MNKTLVKVKGLKRKFGNDFALNGLDFTLGEKGLVGILGHSGSGKTTLLGILSGLDVGYSGSVKVFGKEVKKLAEKKRSHMRLHQMGYVFQDYRLLELETAFANVYASLQAIYSAKREDLKQKTLDLLSFVGLKKRAKQRVNTLSGGEKQRVALARALASDPKILLADEPTGALDETSAAKVFSYLRGIAKKRLVLLITHDEESARQYCDRLIHLQDGKIVKQEDVYQGETTESIPKSLRLKQRKSRGSLSSGFCFAHGLSLMKAKPFRTLLSQGALTLGLSALGIVTYVASSIETEIQSAFSTLVPASTIVMTPRDENNVTIGNIYAGTLEDAAFLVDEYPDSIADFGTCLALDYENWFCDDNFFSYTSGASFHVLPGFSARHINDYLWYTPGRGEVVYPRAVTNMKKDEVILGLPYQTMFQTCLAFHIERTYQSLGDYLLRNRWQIVLHASHIEWGFEDEQLFDVVGVIATSSPLVYHEDHRWNRKVFLDSMGFRSSQVEEVASPQYVLEIPYIQLACDLEEFRKLCRKEEEMDRFLFEHVSDAYHPFLCKEGERSNLPRLFLYSCDKGGVRWSDIEAIRGRFGGILGHNIVSSGGYYASTFGVMNGFLSKAFFGDDLDRLHEIGEIYSDLPLDESGLTMTLPDHVLDASYLAVGEKSIRISSDVSSLTSGRPSEGLEECLLNASLYEAWGCPEEIHFVLEISQEEKGNFLHRDFRYMSLKVVGTVEEEFATVYVISNWTADAPFALLDMSPFVLEPSGVQFFLDSTADSSTLIKTLNKEFPRYVFVDPSLEVGSSVSSTLGYIDAVLYGFSGIALLLSSLLFSITLMLSLGETMHEGRLFFALGFPRSSLSRLFFCQSLLFVFIALGGSSLLVLGAQFAVKFYLSSAFGSGIRGGISYLPFLLVFGVAIAFVIACRIGLSIYARRSEIGQRA